MIAGTFVNKYPGACFFCTKRVRAKDGHAWKDATLGGFTQAHGECLAEALADGNGPRIVPLGERVAPTGAAPGGNAWIVRRVRDVLRNVRLDTATSADLAHAVAQLRVVVLGQEPLPGDAGGQEGESNVPF